MVSAADFPDLGTVDQGFTCVHFGYHNERLTGFHQPPSRSRVKALLNVIFQFVNKFHKKGLDSM